MRKLMASCQCGAVNIELNHKPDFVNDCNCSLCARFGALWGYYDPADVSIVGTTTSYVRPDRSAPVVEVHTCITCEVTTHWALTQAHQDSTGISDKMGVNMRLFDKSDLRGVELRFPDGLAWDGEQTYGYVKPATTL